MENKEYDETYPDWSESEENELESGQRKWKAANGNTSRNPIKKEN
jgi:hypothetical protein